MIITISALTAFVLLASSLFHYWFIKNRQADITLSLYVSLTFTSVLLLGIGLIFVIYQNSALHEEVIRIDAQLSSIKTEMED